MGNFAAPLFPQFNCFDIPIEFSKSAKLLFSSLMLISYHHYKKAFNLP